MKRDLRAVSPDLYDEEKYRQGVFVCDLCNGEWPLSHRRTHTGGERVGVLCCYEPEGDSVDRDLKRANASKMAAILSAQEITKPLRGPDGQYYPGAAEFADGNSGASGITLVTPSPVVLVRGGAAVAVVLSGFGFTSDDTFTYGAGGITDSTPPALISDSEWNLLVQASGGMAAGRYRLTFNSDIWQAFFDVR